MKSKIVDFIKNNPIIIPFVVVQTVFYVLMHFFDTGYTTEIMYGSIIICFLYASINMNFSWNNAHLIWLGLAFTCVADFFLVVCSPARQIEGMFSFSLTQLTYCIYLFLQERQERKRFIHLLVRVVVVMVCSIAPFFVLYENVDLLSVLSMFYISNLVLNAVFAFLQKQLRLFGVGLLLFILCDFAVGFCAGAGIYFEVVKGGLIAAIVNSSFNVAWLFYLPSQTIIAICLALQFKRVKEQEKYENI